MPIFIPIGVGIVAISLLCVAIVLAMRAQERVTAAELERVLGEHWPSARRSTTRTTLRSPYRMRAVASVSPRVRPPSRVPAVRVAPCNARRRRVARPPARRQATIGLRTRRRSAACSRKTSTRRRSRGA